MKRNLGEVAHTLNIIDDTKYKKEEEDLFRRNFQFDPNSIQKIILSPVFFGKSRFNKIESINEDLSMLYFRNEPANDNALLKFLSEIKNSLKDRIYQMDLGFCKTSTSAEHRLHQMIIEDLNFERVTIRRIKQ